MQITAPELDGKVFLPAYRALCILCSADTTCTKKTEEVPQSPPPPHDLALTSRLPLPPTPIPQPTDSTAPVHAHPRRPTVRSPPSPAPARHAAPPSPPRRPRSRNSGSGPPSPALTVQVDDAARFHPLAAVERRSRTLRSRTGPGAGPARGGGSGSVRAGPGPVRRASWRTCVALELWEV